MTKKLASLVMAFAISGLLATGSPNLAAAEANASLEQKLEQCQAAFKAMRSKSATREEAARARAQHFKLMVDILQNINNANVKAVEEGRPLTPEELSNNVRVMGHLVEMLAQDHMAPTQEWSYVY